MIDKPKNKKNNKDQIPKGNPVTMDEIRKVTEQFQKQMDFNREAIRRTRRGAIMTTFFSAVAILVACSVAAYIILGSTFFHDADRARQKAMGKIYQQYEIVKAQQQEIMARQQALESTVAQVRDRAGSLLRGDIDLIAELRNIRHLSDELTTVNARIDMLSKTPAGQAFLDSSASDLHAMVQGLQGRVGSVETALEQAKQENSELADMLEGVSGDQLKAAAMLLAANQLRNSLRQGGSYETDLETVRALAGDDPELLAALIQLEPYARQGVMSPQMLGNELRGLAGEIIMAGIHGEEISWQSRFRNRLDSIVTITPQDGGAASQDTKAVVARAELLMNQGDIEGAISELQTLQGAPADAAQPWIEEAKTRLMATQTSSQLARDLISRLTGQIQPSNLGIQPNRR